VSQNGPEEDQRVFRVKRQSRSERQLVFVVSGLRNGPVLRRSDGTDARCEGILLNSVWVVVALCRETQRTTNRSQGNHCIRTSTAYPPHHRTRPHPRLPNSNTPYDSPNPNDLLPIIPGFFITATKIEFSATRSQLQTNIFGILIEILV
jgi:hypothetical protein